MKENQGDLSESESEKRSRKAPRQASRPKRDQPATVSNKNSFDLLSGEDDGSAEEDEDFTASSSSESGSNDTTSNLSDVNDAGHVSNSEVS
jgi:hypothetical protein